MNPPCPTPYTHRRKVRYGDCDASRNYFTPRAIDYAVEAVEAWSESTLEISWTDLIRRHGLFVHVLSAEAEFLRPLTAGEIVQAQIEIVDIQDAQFMLRVAGRNETEVLCFRVHLTVCFFDAQRSEVISIPPNYRERIRRHRGCGADEKSAKDSGCRTIVAPGLLPLATTGSGDAPFTLQRRVVYGECGLSGTIYPPRIFDYLLEAVGEWYEKHLGISWREQNIRRRGQPFLHVRCDYLCPLGAGQSVNTRVTVRGLGKASITYSVTGHDEKGSQYFNAQLTACYCVEKDGMLKATPFPDEMRKKIAAYKDACDRYQHQSSA